VALNPSNILPGLVKAEGEDPLFGHGDRVLISDRSPIGHYRVPHYVRGKAAVVKDVIARAVDNEEEGFGRNAGLRRHYYRVSIPLSALWHGYAGAPNDELRIEVFEDWLKRT